VAKTKPPAKLHLKADANGKLKFNKTQLTVKHGKVKLIMKNPGSSGQQHGIAVKGHGLDKDGPIVNPGKTSTVTVKLKPGAYSFYCPVLGHAGAGMKGHITVK
jgi:plastocyanin